MRFQPGSRKDRPIAGLGEWIMNRAQIPVKEYEQLAADAGMKYLVITSKHHDGFAMYHSAVSKYNVVEATPFHRDPLKELAAACARHGIRFGLYYS